MENEIGSTEREEFSHGGGGCFGKSDIYDKLFWGVLLLLGGNLWLMEAVGYLSSGWDNYFWPFAAIWLGTMILARIVFDDHQKDEVKTIYARLRSH